MIRKLLFSLVLIPFFGMAQFVQNFDGDADLPTDWTVLNGGDAGTWILVDFTGSTGLTAHSGTSAAAIGYDGLHDDYLVSPAVTVMTGVSDFLTFWGRSRDASYPEVISVKISTTTPTMGAFTNVLAPLIDPASGANFYKYEFDLTAYIGQTIYIGFHSETDDMFYFDLDDVSVGAIPSCLEPTAISSSNPTTESIDITATSTGLGFQVQYGPVGFTLGTGTTTATIAGSSTTISGLTSSSAYQYYVRTDCGNSDYSAWVGPLSFSTLCETIIAFPYTQGFDATSLPTCWSNEAVVGTSNWTFVASNGNATITPRTGSGMAEFRNTLTGNTTKLVTPPIDLTGVASPQLDFYYANVNWVGDIDELRVYYKTSLASPWIQIGTDYTAEMTSWTQVVLPLPNPSTTYYVAFEGTSNWARGLNLDDVVISAAPLSTSDFANNSLKLHPNPVKNFLNIEYTEAIKTVEVYNMLGQKVFSQDVNANTTQLDLTALNSGNYMAKIQFANAVKTVKVIKE